MGNLLSNDFKQVTTPDKSSDYTCKHLMLLLLLFQRYFQITQDFVNGQSPAVVQSRRSLTPTAEDQTQGYITQQSTTHKNTQKYTHVHKNTQ